ncbi:MULTISPECIES: beta-ketoacyl synthase N-terminal-like domain-containing protein [Flavobacterium]|uniref:Beta-ketoacyl synthase N-terminal-like domain-containing protein n=1 Tax=Flavobacterium hankyongi TaxID=1176532 RepID=A0ABP8ZRE7_9FLAO|nr:beta-ketoacyl synthase N-terminal-like domain-containing protein [Flavobacterium sp. N1846]
MKQKIAITSLSSISALGNTPDEIWNNYLSDKSFIDYKVFNGKHTPVAQIPERVKTELKELRNSDSKYRALDETVLMAILASRDAVKKAGWDSGENFGINIGSSRGATQLFENHHKEFIETGKTATLTSPTTTLGNISSWVAHDLKSKGLAISHSITCSTALHAILNAVAWLQSGMATKFLVGASESPLTDFTLAQMDALKIYSKELGEYPCRALDLEKKKNTMVLGEGVAVACLEVGENDKALAYVEGIGYATDDLEHNISISEEAKCFQESMKMALQNTPLDEVDAIVMHAPGTIKGDSSEYKAIQKVFGTSLVAELAKAPLLTTNKWKLGHTFGTSGMLSVELAILMMQNNTFIPVPFVSKQTIKKPIRKVLVNAVGFGGNAVSILLTL